MKYLLLFFGLAISGCQQASQTADTLADQAQSQQEIHTLMDAWHHAAATGDEQVFFDTMSEDGIYLGTDKNERWEKGVFQDWSAKYFERDTAWAFTPHDRVIYFSDAGKTAWFEELLDTWMGPCRGSGVLTSAGGQWQLRHYNLAMLIDYNDVNAVIEVIKAPDEPLDSLLYSR